MQTHKELINLYKAGGMFLIILSLVAIVYGYGQIKENRLIGGNAQNTITVSGEGKVDAKPDLATVSVTIRENAKTTKEAQDKVAKKWAMASVEIKKLVDDKDIKTNNYQTYPKYVYLNTGKSYIESYEVSQTIDIKVRKTDDVAVVLDVLAKSGINEVSGPNFTIDKPEDLQDEARGLAIADAKSKAAKLANQLGVDLGRIVSYSEDGGGGHNPPVAYMTRGNDVTEKLSNQMPSLPTGEQTIQRNITITFEIK